ncbi:Gfo/Idh/MocA family protein [Paenibacillus sacheonensis]|uniref:Gfo/Idh/MocA family oxidoreductase n=1 Tax=Paenibacillus sacheonensis TaxID=742054 RepID=A0A7X4YTU5_9BACL|nr:Gfo/Idh/MocA family oxidoreductase [Paenibacillus sacheonensis]MBM7568652.1 putative dehydrogenase [Paenibacillus sacheonensis]NBC72457.1 Gfo/Idh/MocA family oxidoreductase [Paenibacillus sacheonensis]
MKTFRIGLIGLGGMGQAHIRWMSEMGGRFRLVAISDVNPPALADMGDKLGISEAKRYADFERLIADPDVDAVVSVTPNNVHAAIVRACLEAGKPFLAEKPFTRDFEEAVPLLALYERQPVAAMIGFTYRYTPAFRYARELVRQGRIGRVRSFSSQYLQGWGAAQYNCPFVWRFDKAITGTGTLGDLGSHMIDLARFLFGGEFLELTAQMQTIVPERPDPLTGEPVRIEVDDFVSFQARMTGDIRGVFQSSRNAIGSGNQHEISIYGDTGTIHASTLDEGHTVLIGEDGEGQLSRSTIAVPQRCRIKQYDDFLALLDGTETDGLPGIIDGYRNQEVLEAIVRASEIRSLVEL